MPMNNRTANSLTGDVTLSLLLDEAGNLKVKAFTRTIDRFDENQACRRAVWESLTGRASTISAI